MNPLLERIAQEIEIRNAYTIPMTLAAMDRFDHRGMCDLLRGLYACLGEIGIGDDAHRDQRITLLSVLVNRRLTSSKDLTQVEVRVICVELRIHANDIKMALERAVERIAG